MSPTIALLFCLEGGNFWIAFQEKRSKAERESCVGLKRHGLKFGETEADRICRIDYQKE